MTIGVYRSEQARHLVLRVAAGALLPDALVTALRAEGVSCGWLRGSGVVTDVELRAYDAGLGTLGSVRRIEGPIQVIALDGSIGMLDGEPSLSMRALLARDADRGLESLAGEIGSARAMALEVFVTSLDDLTVVRALDEAAGVWVLGEATASAGSPGERPPAGRPVPAPPAAWSAALDASDRAVRDPRPRAAAAGTATSSAAIPARPPRPGPDLDAPFPEPGDVVDHFAFGRCDVLKSDGDRLHLKVHKDGRIREIALGMLRVSNLTEEGDGRRRFKLERRM